MKLLEAILEDRRAIGALATCQAFEASCEFEFKRYYPPTINHSKETAFARAVLSALVGENNVLEFEPTMGSEDFSFYLLEKPGCYFLIGNGDGSHGITDHGSGPCMPATTSMMSLFLWADRCGCV
jgi:metal-dependent amidase/aminoacylase/carboxypeptidase family protein